MRLFEKLGRKIDNFATKIDTKIHKNVDKFIESHAHHGSEPAHSVSKRSVDSEEVGTPPTPSAPTPMRESHFGQHIFDSPSIFGGQSILIGHIAEPDHQAIGF
ncbi:hypothetical protein [Chelatococcus asaccharovorans]|uniref:Uncharacterized protein n=1 Tax=Chelatococcus asaccharovorans TaxID=28210 RepID=A0A2V3U2N9_9HYPH|nr:hypothetical protein [Chelatococcus asaccharovorans]MBS7702250.1 hypothetical protein [Chelatococcus asaccharovorans]PXW56551.1 hypothetical protein C7450_108303 [Chelatococcus asaccharovorans]